MSPRRLRWTGLACLALSALTALTGFFAQALLVLGGALLFVAVQIPVGAAGGAVGPTMTTLAVPRVLPPALFVASLFLMVALVCFVKSTRSAAKGASGEV